MATPPHCGTRASGGFANEDNPSEAVRTRSQRENRVADNDQQDLQARRDGREERFKRRVIRLRSGVGCAV